MNVQLKKVTRENWEEVLKLKVKDQQNHFVPSAAVSLAKVYIKPDGDQVEYIPFAIYDDEVIVGFIMHAYEEGTNDMYWINGFIIDERYLGKGYGRSALCEMIEWIKNKFPICSEIRLTVHRDNHHARRMYTKCGFLQTGDRWGEEDVLFLSLN